MFELGNEVLCEALGDLPAVAACDGEIGKMLIPNVSEKEVEIDLEAENGWVVTDYRVLEGTNGLVSVGLSEKLVVPAQKIVLVEFKKSV